MSQSQRVVVTGAGSLCPLGKDWPSIRDGLRNGVSGVQAMPDWAQIKGLRCHLAAPVEFEAPAHFSRRQLRSMGRVAQMAVRATELAIEQAGLDPQTLCDGRTGVAYGSANGNVPAALEFVKTITEADARAIKATSYIRMMTHTAAVNIGVFFGLTGRLIPTTSACTAASQAIGFGYETIRSGAQDVMLVGGAEELTAAHSAVFDALLATSNANDQPGSTPRPFDQQRDGLVLGEGAATLVLESMAHAQARGATVLAEVVGFATNTDGTHITAPNSATQADCLAAALRDADLDPTAIGYVNAHGTATDNGDISEGQATLQVLGKVAISSLKGHMGHTLGACGALEAWASIAMMREGWMAPTLNLRTPDPACGDLDYVLGSARPLDTDYVMSNNFAFGGVNTSLIFRRLE